MANDLEQVHNTLILPLAMDVLIANAPLLQHVRRDIGFDAAGHNHTVRHTKPQVFGAPSAMNTVTGAVPQDLVAEEVNVTLDTWNYQAIQMNDKEYLESVSRAVLPSAVEAAAASLGRWANIDGLKKMEAFHAYSGTPNVAPSSGEDITAGVAELDRMLVPDAGRFGLINPKAKQGLVNHFSSFNEAGTNSTLASGKVGSKYGIDFYMDQNIGRKEADIDLWHESGTFATAAVNGAVLEGATTVAVDGGIGAETYLKGDLIDIAGIDSSFVVTEDATAAGGAISTLKIDPPVPSGGIEDDAVVTLVASHTNNFIIHPDALVFASRPLSDANATLPTGGNTITSYTDPATGLTLRIEILRDGYKATTVWRMDLLYGWKVLNSDLGVRVLG